MAAVDGDEVERRLDEAFEESGRMTFMGCCLDCLFDESVAGPSQDLLSTMIGPEAVCYHAMNAETRIENFDRLEASRRCTKES